MNKTTYQSHTCDGCSAKITIEWSVNDNKFTFIKSLSDAEQIADEVLSFSGPKMRDMVQAMRGKEV